MKFRMFIFIAVSVLLLPMIVHADRGVVARYVPHGEPIGTSRLSFLFWDVYDVTLYAPKTKWKSNAPYALVITYLRKVNGDEIAKRSAEEMRGLGFADERKLEDWYLEMAKIFPDVEEATVLTGVRDEAGRTLFYKHDMRIGTIEDPRFADWFFGIWLDEKTSEPKMRKQLLGLTQK